MYKIRARYTKTDMMKFISHLDLVRLMQRAFRRAEIPMVYSQGFNPHPKLTFATALSVGVSSEGEYLDVEIKSFIDLDVFKSKVNQVLPEGMRILQCKYMEQKSESIMAVIEYASYLVNVRLKESAEIEQIKNSINHFLSLEEILVLKKPGKRNNDNKKEINIRTYINQLELFSIEKDELMLKMVLATGSRGNLKPEVVIQKLAVDEQIPLEIEKTRIHRLDLYAMVDGKMVTPIV
ncbi:TIGR03936 family radical SAM-associated protein [Geosporobacter ferrireducens]|uniref:DUF2344 domain-containing protein n=1 Tax=Geosporobacter ferrireducens TaxID=1424294 RepID=A0A1D8GPE9_9FIRM|nr:TIGR03936 family radical SAM-associated protein [Geosporobacter ferrireducens]AOT72765.1 hypothetical protein Gferi_26335 [Geosporobacter ferrireducens]MTI55180.1 DUF2344 domain-containing protein [Geosporobacter ferrireducens]